MNWPATLPQGLLKSSFSDGPPDNLLRTQMEAGPAKVRRRTTAGVRPLSGAMRVTAAQWAIFKTFFDTDLQSGALSFAFPDPDNEAATITVRLLNYKRASAGGLDFKLELTFEVVP